MMEQHHTPLTKEFFLEALQGLKDDLQRFATKDDLQRFATKDDLQGFATKDDLQRFATKDDFRKIAVAFARLEGDMHDVKHALKTEFATKKELEPFLRLADQAPKEMEAHRELRSTRGVLLDDVSAKVEDHERRLRGIEGRS